MSILFIQNLYGHTNPITIFAHGIIDNHEQMNRHITALKEPFQSFDFPDALPAHGWNFNHALYQAGKLFGKSINRNQMYMGQGQDIITLHQQIHADQNYILYGLSRGGATCINYLAQYNPDNVAALILDGTPANMLDAIDDIQYTIGYKFAPNDKAQQWIFQTLFPAYSSDSIASLQALQNIKNKELPILIIHAYDDARVSVASSWKLYTAFYKAGFTHVYLCNLTTGKHGHYLQGKDAQIYLQAVHSFYKKYSFSYTPEYATLQLDSLQPATATINNKLHLIKQRKINQYIQRQKQYTLFGMLLTSALAILCDYHPYVSCYTPTIKDASKSLHS